MDKSVAMAGVDGEVENGKFVDAPAKRISFGEPGPEASNEAPIHSTNTTRH
jgi:hypothetical protein